VRRGGGDDPVERLDLAAGLDREPLSLLADRRSAGTQPNVATKPLDDFPHLQATDPQTITERAFVAHLPQRLLGHPKGGALAVIGHVERTWGYSYSDEWQGTDKQVDTFESTMIELMQGYPVGMAMEYFNQRYAGLSADLTEKQELVKYRVKIADETMAGLWTANNDARAYVVLGDPAVRLAVA